MPFVPFVKVTKKNDGDLLPSSVPKGTVIDTIRKIGLFNKQGNSMYYSYPALCYESLIRHLQHCPRRPGAALLMSRARM